MHRTLCPGPHLDPNMTSLLFSAIPHLFGVLVFPAIKERVWTRRPSALISVVSWPPTSPGGVSCPLGPLLPHLYICAWTGELDGHPGFPGLHVQSSQNICINSKDPGRLGVQTWTLAADPSSVACGGLGSSQATSPPHTGPVRWVQGAPLSQRHRFLAEQEVKLPEPCFPHL